MFKGIEILKKQLSEKYKNLENRFLESNIFNLLKEKYQSLDILQQTLIKYLSVSFVLVAFAFLPLFYFFSSISYWSEFKKKQSLSLNLLKKRQKISHSVFLYSQNQLKNKIEGIVKKYSDSDFTLKDKRSSLQKIGEIYKIDFNIQLNHLNVRQAVKLGTELHNISQVRLSSITMNENKEFPLHYNTTYEISAFVPIEKIRKPFPKKQLPRSKNKTLNIRQNKNNSDSFSKKIENDLVGTIRKSKKENKVEKPQKKRELQKNKSIDLKEKHQEEDIIINL